MLESVYAKLDNVRAAGNKADRKEAMETGDMDDKESTVEMTGETGGYQTEASMSVGPTGRMT
jgi:hypothetical protein